MDAEQPTRRKGVPSSTWSTVLELVAALIVGVVLFTVAWQWAALWAAVVFVLIAWWLDGRGKDASPNDQPSDE
jgi:ABC-type bacteriocin/lantibiotic exporter with double-glycine peptidase domain